MKIGVYLDSYRPQDGGGFTMQGELLGSLSKLQGKSKHEFVIFSSEEPTPPNTVGSSLKWIQYSRSGWDEKILGFVARMLPSLRKKISSFSSFEKRARAAEVEFVWFLGPRHMELDLPYLVTVWDLQHRKQPWFPEVSEGREWDARERLMPGFLRRAAGIIAGTPTGQEEINQFFQIPKERIHILPHPTPGFALKKYSVQNPPFGLQAGFIFYPAQFWAHKNHANLLLALKKLRDKGLKIPLVLTGSDFGNQAHVEKAIIQLGLQNQVKILGFVNRNELIGLYQSALVLAYVSFFGPENLPPLEAFALGCPVIAAEVDGAKEQFGKAALFVDPKNPDEIASAVYRIHKDAKLRARLVSAGSKRAKSWTSDDFVRGVFKILDDFEPIRRTWT